jgi:tripeptidyl-peptidase-1
MIGIDGQFELVFGTSASSPVVGSIFTLVNDARLAIGKRPVGFLNPLVCSFLMTEYHTDCSILTAAFH